MINKTHWKRRPLSDWDELCDYCSQKCKMKNDYGKLLCRYHYREEKKEEKEE